ATTEAARDGLLELLSIDEDQARAILDMQLRRLAALERQKIQDRHAELERMIAEFQAIIASPARQREIVSEELQEIVDKHGDDRRTKVLMGYDGDMSVEDLIPEEEMVVTITRGGYVKRTRIDNYRSQARGGKGIKGANLRGDDVVEHFFVTSTHN
ncbi:DNA gyrase subunit A, partial [Escherichia coli]|nr:DNA gyrase subunit A [Escherichia coli]